MIWPLISVSLPQQLLTPGGQVLSLAGSVGTVAHSTWRLPPCIPLADPCQAVICVVKVIQISFVEVLMSWVYMRGCETSFENWVEQLKLSQLNSSYTKLDLQTCSVHMSIFQSLLIDKLACCLYQVDPSVLDVASPLGTAVNSPASCVEYLVHDLDLKIRPCHRNLQSFLFLLIWT